MEQTPTTRPASRNRQPTTVLRHQASAARGRHPGPPAATRSASGRPWTPTPYRRARNRGERRKRSTTAELLTGPAPSGMTLGGWPWALPPHACPAPGQPGAVRHGLARTERGQESTGQAHHQCSGQQAGRPLTRTTARNSFIAGSSPWSMVQTVGSLGRPKGTRVLAEPQVTAARPAGNLRSCSFRAPCPAGPGRRTRIRARAWPDVERKQPDDPGSP